MWGGRQVALTEADILGRRRRIGGLIRSQAGQITIALTINVEGGSVAGVRFVLNPEKLRALQRPTAQP
jgi:hypothetical protein